MRLSDVSQTLSTCTTVFATICSKILTAGAILLQRLDHVDALLQDALLAFEAVHILLDLFQAGPLGSQRRDLGVGLVEFAFLLVVGDAQDRQRDADGHQPRI